MEFVRRRVFQFLSLFCLFLSLVLSCQNSSFLFSCSYPPLHLLCFFFFFNSLLKTNFLQLSHSWIPFFLTPFRTPPSSLSNAQIIIWSSSPPAIHPFFLFCYVFLLFQVSTCSTAPTTTMARWSRPLLCIPCRFTWKPSPSLQQHVASSSRVWEKKNPWFKRGLEICPSSIEFTSVRNMNTIVKRKCE